VTRKFFENTSNTLGKCIINVKVALEEKFTLLSKKQDTLEQKQDDTITHVLDVKDEVDTCLIIFKSINLKKSYDLQRY